MSFQTSPSATSAPASPSLETGTETEPGTETGTHAFPSSPVPLAPPLAVKRARELNEDAITYVEIVGSAVEMAKRLGPQAAPRASPSRVLRSTLRRLRERMGPAVASRGRPRIVPLGNPRKPSVALLRGGARVRVHERRHGHAGEGATRAQRIRRDAHGPVANPDAVDDTLTEKQTDHNIKRMVKILKHKTKAAALTAAFAFPLVTRVVRHN